MQFTLVIRPIKHTEFYILSSSKEYVENGGALMILLGEGGEVEFNTNLNFLLEEYGMSINNGEQIIERFQLKEFITHFVFQIQP